MAKSVNSFVASRKGARALAVLLAALGIFLALSLISHSSHDYPNSSRPAAESLNWAGSIGALVSYASFVAVGYGAYCLPLLVLLWAWNRFMQRPLRPMTWRSVGLLCMALIFSIGTGLPPYSSHAVFELGGWLGVYASNLILIPYGGRVGSAVILSSLFLAAMILTVDLDLRIFVRGPWKVVRLVWSGFAWVLALPERDPNPGRRMTAEQEEDEGKEGVQARSTAISADGETAPLAEVVAEDPEVARVEGGTGTPEDVHYVEEIYIARELEVPAGAEAAGNSGAVLPRIAPKTRITAAAKGLQKTTGSADYQTPVPGMVLDQVSEVRQGGGKEKLLQNARTLEEALNDFDIAGKVVEVSPGPVVTRYEVEPAAGVKVNRIVALSDDLARVMRARGIRIQAPVPGKSVVGVEIANQERDTVYLREILESGTFQKAESRLTIALGKTIAGEPFVTDLAMMPHLLVAGATGSGKSVCINALISSILFKATPEEVRLLMVDPKVVELTAYNEIPHLLVPVITEPKKAAEALRWAVAEMERRYLKLAALGVRHISDYNRRLERGAGAAREEGAEPEPPMAQIVIVIDEFADLMLTAPADVETLLMGLAQKSRAVGIHIILATQRPSVNVVTGVIKANFPSRIAFQVASKTDSRTILDCNGAERLLGMGDMLFLPGGQGEPVRIHGAYVSGEETDRLVEAIKSSGYRTEEVAVFSEHADIYAAASARDELFEEALRLTLEHQQASTSFLQRRMKVGYSRAARLMDELELAGIVGPAEGAKPRQILVDVDGEGVNGAAVGDGEPG